MKIEYLITTTDDSFCTDRDSFLHLLQTNPSITVENSEILLDGIDQYSYELKTGFLEKESHRYFQLSISTIHQDASEKNAELLNNVRKAINTIFSKLVGGTSVNVLWNDISFFYSQKAYPLIYKVENLMRKLIMRFMYVNVGTNWFDTQVPPKIKDQVDKKISPTNDNKSNPIFELDFIHLSNILLFEYRTISLNELDRELANADELNDLDFAKLKHFLPKSNWDRYFSKVLKIDGKKLKDEWNELYDLRKRVAHNKEFTKTHFLRTEKLVNSVVKEIELALEKVDNIELTKKQKEKVFINLPEDLTKKLETKIEDLRFSDYTLGFLKENGFETLKDLVSIEVSDYMKIKGFKKKTLEELETVILHNELSFGLSF